MIEIPGLCVSLLMDAGAALLRMLGAAESSIRACAVVPHSFHGTDRCPGKLPAVRTQAESRVSLQKLVTIMQCAFLEALIVYVSCKLCSSLSSEVRSIIPAGVCFPSA